MVDTSVENGSFFPVQMRIVKTKILFPCDLEEIRFLIEPHIEKVNRNCKPHIVLRRATFSDAMKHYHFTGDNLTNMALITRLNKFIDS